MATLISAGNSEGTYGRCDAKCYMAKHPKCDCICGGRNHGVGLVKAQANTAELAERLLEESGATSQLGLFGQTDATQEQLQPVETDR